MKVLTMALMGLLCMGASNCSHAVKVDSEMSAIVARDFTTPLEGCGQQLVPGLLYCKMREGPLTEKAINIVGPLAECSLDKTAPCVFFTIFSTVGEPAFGGSIPHGKSSVSIPWEALLKRKEVGKGDAGIWLVNLRVSFLGTDNQVHESRSQGEIVLHVYDKDYKPLHEITDDPNFVWQTVENGLAVKMTSGLRTYVEKAK